MKISDPVCGMKIDSDTAHAVEAFEGRHYHFCSAQCRDTFMRDPSRYATSSQGDGEPACGHHHRGRTGHGCCG